VQPVARAERRDARHVDLGARPTPEAVGEIAARYGLEFDMASIPALCERHGLHFPAAP